MVSHISLAYHFKTQIQSRLSATNLALRDRPDPYKSKIQGDDDYADDPEDLCIVGRVVAEDNGEDDATKVSCGADNAGEDTLSNVRIGCYCCCAFGL
jgi:hypothetical protein